MSLDKTKRIIDRMTNNPGYAQSLKDSISELREVSKEMRERRVNKRQRNPEGHTSPTLIAWADRIDAAIARISK
jgi:hypothetical protein